MARLQVATSTEMVYTDYEYRLCFMFRETDAFIPTCMRQFVRYIMYSQCYVTIQHKLCGVRYCAFRNVKNIVC